MTLHKGRCTLSRMTNAWPAQQQIQHFDPFTMACTCHIKSSRFWSCKGWDVSSPYPGDFSSPSWAKSSSAMILEYCLSVCSIGYLCYFHLSFLFLSLLTVDEHSQMAGWEGKQIPHLFLSHPPSKYESQSASENESNTIHNICLTAATGRNISISLGAFRQGNHPISGCKKCVVYQKALLWNTQNNPKDQSGLFPITIPTTSMIDFK